LDPTATVFLYHWYEGEPPLTGVAVKVTGVPAQTGFAEATIVTLTGRFGFTVIVIPVDVAGDPVRQGVAFEVILTVTTSLLTSAVVVYVALFVPTFEPFTLHW
jgi:hypothetical protein